MRAERIPIPALATGVVVLLFVIAALLGGVGGILLAALWFIPLTLVFVVVWSMIRGVLALERLVQLKERELVERAAVRRSVYDAAMHADGYDDGHRSASLRAMRPRSRSAQARS